MTPGGLQRCQDQPEHIPEPESFVPSTRHDALAVRRHRQVENAVAVAGQLGHLGEAGVFPHEDLVLRVPVGRHQLTGVLRPSEIADLISGELEEVREGLLLLPDCQCRYSAWVAQ